MKKISVFVIALLVATVSFSYDFVSSQYDTEAIVVREALHDYFILTSKKYNKIIIQNFSGIEEGDVLYGRFNKYGSVILYNKSTAKAVKVYIEEYGITADDSYHWLKQRGHWRNY